MKRLLALTLPALLLMVAFPANAIPLVVQDNVRLVKNVPGSTGGHAVVEGNRLYVGAYGLGLRAFDVSNPADPKVIGAYMPGPKVQANPPAGDAGARADAVPDAAIWDGRHIVSFGGTRRASGQTDRTEFIDFTNPSAPKLLWTLGPDQPEGEAHNGDIVDARRLWLPSGGTAGNGLRIYDLNPILAEPPAKPTRLFAADPVQLWNASPYREGRPVGAPFTHVHDIEVYVNHLVQLPADQWVDQDGDGTPDTTTAPRDIALVAEGGAYAGSPPGGALPGAGNTGSIFVVDITNPTAPVVLNRWLHGNEPGTNHAIRYHHEIQLLDGNKSIAIVTDEDLHSGCDAGGVYTLRLSPHLTQATKLAEYFNGSGTPAANCSAHVFSTKGNYMFMGSYNAGLQVIDLSDPAKPKRAGQYIAAGANSWGALYHKGYVYVGDFGGRGLDVFEFIPSPHAEGVVKVMNPGTRSTHGLAEHGCDTLQNPYGPTNGTDGLMLPIPESHRDGTHTIRAVGSSEAPYDLDIWFFDESCASMSGTGIATESADEKGPIPADAHFASVDLFEGAPTYVMVELDPA
jgi:hypothetical protein